MVNKARTVDNGRYTPIHPWPEGCHISGGSRGLVLSRTPGKSYNTAFFEFADEGTFIRGESETIQGAEEVAWNRYQAQLECPGHEYEQRGYRNGAGICKHCNRFEIEVFDVREVGHPCSTCHVGTNWTAVGDTWFCRDHAPSEEQKRAMREELRAQGVQPYRSF